MVSGTGYVLLVNGSAGVASTAGMAARAACCQLTTVADIASARELLAKKQYDLIVIDGSPPKGASLDVLRGTDLTRQGHVVVAGIAAHSAGREAVPPAFECLVEPISTDTLTRLMKDAVSRSPSREIPAGDGFGGMIGRTMRMQALFEAIRRVAPLEVGVLVNGESGTGKELVAQALHKLSGRNGEFVAVNCGAISAELLSSHLFGHERGSFTGATQLHAGYFEQARGGTVFLDEITEMPPAMQVYLLRVIETHSLTRVGGSREIPVDVRVIAASNRDLQHAVAAGDLRSDLYFRLLEFPLVIPPLRERREDIPLLAQHFLSRLNARHGTSKHFATDAMRRLMASSWPGNVRELLHTVRRQYIVADDAGEVEIGEAAGPTLRRRASDLEQPERRKGAAPAAAVPSLESGDTIRFRVGTTFEEIERQVLLKTLAHVGNDKREAARVLGVSLKTIYNKLLRYRSQGLIAQEVLDEFPDDRGRAA
ncbi:MAG: sigma 54-interacting transcriptional regulator [Rhodanobacteraceae bacterium]